MNRIGILNAIGELTKERDQLLSFKQTTLIVNRLKEIDKEADELAKKLKSSK